MILSRIFLNISPLKPFKFQSLGFNLAQRNHSRSKQTSPYRSTEITNNNDDGEIDQAVNDKPVQYTTSRAFQYKAYENFREKEKDESTVPPYNSIIIRVSFAIFLIYFLVLREPNDMDDMLSRDLFEIMPELEIPMLEVDIKRLEKQGINVDGLKQKLNELKRLEMEKKNKQHQQQEQLSQHEQ